MKPSKKLLKEIRQIARRAWPLTPEEIEDNKQFGGDPLEVTCSDIEVRVEHPFEEDSIGAQITFKDSRRAGLAMKAAVLVLAGEFTSSSAKQLITELKKLDVKKR
jgi:hypothetical protein